MSWDQMAVLIGVVVAVVGGPLSAMVFYLKGIRDSQTQLRNDIEANIDEIKKDQAALERRIGYVERDFTTREEFVREIGLARRQQEKMTDIMIAVQGKLETQSNLTAQLTAMGREAIQSVERLMVGRMTDAAGLGGNEP